MDYSQSLFWQTLATHIKEWGRLLGFQQVGISGIELTTAENHLLDWLAAGYHGEMAYMARHGSRRSRPADLIPGTQRVISARMNYLPAGAAESQPILSNPSLGYVSRYALGRDYHKVLRGRLEQLSQRLRQALVEHGLEPGSYRVFTDSGPVLEKDLAQQAGLGWIGKHTNLLTRGAGSWFFLGEIYTNLPLPPDPPAQSHCGRCQRCLTACPTGAFIGPWQLDARRCIAYLTIELAGPIPLELRPLLGNRIYGCDDCQLVCPWNHSAPVSQEGDFAPRHGLDRPLLTSLMGWSVEEFLARTTGSAIRRLGHERLLRNVAVALGNAPRGEASAIAALRAQANHPSPLVREHVAWALARHQSPP